ncbi:MAG: hypothetical protein AABX88_03060 [Nanoarchaeota archaeon]
MTKVDIGKKVEFEELITAFSKVADKLGWKTEVNDQFEKSYKLGSVKEVEKYSCTKVTLKKRFFGNVMNFNVYKNERPLENFYIGYGGFASKEKVEEYLSAVSDNLK